MGENLPRDIQEGSKGHLASVLNAIVAYEDFIGLFHDTFDELRLGLSRQRVSISQNSLIREIPSLSDNALGISRAYLKARSALACLNLDSEFTREFETFSHKMSALIFIETILYRHEKVQMAKPPSGKAPWFEHNPGESRYALYIE